MAEKLTIAQLQQIHDSAIPYFNELWVRGSENERYYSADPFTKKQKADYANQDRLPFSISSIPNKLNTIIATEKQNRSEWKATPILDFIDSSDVQEIQNAIMEKELKAAIATTRLKTIARTNSMKNVASDIFASGVAMIYGAGEVYREKDSKGKDIIKLRDLDYKNVIWDRNAITYEKNDGVFMAKRDFKYRIDLERQYGKAKVKALPIDESLSWSSREKQQYYVSYNRDGNSDLDLLSVFTHYHKVLRDYYVLVVDGEVVARERTKADAEELQTMIEMPYLSNGDEPPRSDIVRVPEIAIDKYVFTYTDILEYQETDLTLFPISIYQAFQFKDKLWTMTDILKSMQQLANRMLSQIDYAFGVDIKNVYEIVMPYLEGTGLTVDEALAMMKEKGLLLTNRPNAINAIKSEGANPQWVQIMEIMLKLIDEIGGGKTFTGSANSSSQSGRAIQALIGQGELLTTSFIDNRNRFQADLARKVMEFMKLYDNAPYIIKTEAGALTPAMIQMLQQNQMYIPSPDNEYTGYVRMNAHNNYLEDAEFDMSVEFEDLSANKRAEEYDRMTLVEQTDQDLLLSPTWRKKKLSKLTGISYEEREKIGQEIAQAKQAQAEQAQAMEQQKMDMEKARILIQERGNQIPSSQTQSKGAKAAAPKTKQVKVKKLKTKEKKTA